MCSTRSTSQAAQVIDRSPPPDTARVGLLLVGHGSATRPEAAETLARHAAALRESGRFANVRHAVLEGGPDPAQARSELADVDVILVLPLFMSVGYFTRVVLPVRLGPASGPVVRICPSLGVCSELAGSVAEIAQEARAANGWPDGGWDLLLVAHGSTKDPASRQATEAVADRLIGLRGMAQLHTGYLEEPPYLTAVAAQLVRPTVVVGMFATVGGHAEQDVPTALQGMRPPVTYTGAVGADDRVAGLLENIIDRELAQIVAGRSGSGCRCL